MPNNSSLTANSYQGLGFDSTLTSLLAAQQEKKVLASIDYSNFSNFVFFNSAYRKVQTATEFILDNYPVGRTDGFFGSSDFVLNETTSDAIDNFNISANPYELYLVNKLGDPNNIGSSTITASLTANIDESTSAVRTVINIPRDTDMLLTNTGQNAFISNLLDKATTYDAGQNTVTLQGGTATIGGIGTQYLPTTTADIINREHQLTQLLPQIFFDDDETLVLDRYVSALAEVLDIIKIYIDQFASLRLIDYNKPTIPQGDSQAALAQLFGFNIFNQDLRQDITKQLLRASVSGSTSIDDILDELQSRVLNNLMYILKSKGTPRSIKALIKSYGLPEDFLTVREYAAQSKARPTNYNNEIDTYLLDYTNNSVSGDRLAIMNESPVPFHMGPWTGSTFEVRIKMPTLPTTTNVCSISTSGSITSTVSFTSCTATTLSSTFFSALDPNAADPTKLKLFYTSGQICADYTKDAGTLKLATCASLSSTLQRVLSTDYVNVTLRPTNDNVDLNLYYPDIINGQKTITSMNISVSNTLSGSSCAIEYGYQSTVVLGGEINAIETGNPAPNEIGNLFNGEMQEVRIWKTYLADADLTAHANNFESITTQNTDASKQLNSTASLLGMSNPYDDLWCHFKLKENIKKDTNDKGVNSTNVLMNMSGGALSIIGGSATQDLYSKKTLNQNLSMINSGGLLFNILRTSISGEYSLEDINDARLISIVADPINTINKNILNLYDQLNIGNLYGSATSLYNNINYNNSDPYLQNWYQVWPTSTVGNSLMFEGIINYQKAVENLQDIFYSIVSATKQLIPARSHLLEEGMLVKAHLLNRSRQERLKDKIAEVDILGNRSTGNNSITAAQDGLLEAATFFNYHPSSYYTQDRNYSLNRPNITGLTKQGSDARAYVNNFQAITRPIEFFPTYPDKTEVDTVFDRITISPTGSNSIVTCNLKFLSNQRRIKTTEKAVKIIFPTFTDQAVGMLGVNKLITTIDGVTLPRSITEYEFPIHNEDGVSLIITPSPEFQREVMSVDTAAEEPVPIFDVQIIFVNLITQKKTQQLLSYSLAY